MTTPIEFPLQFKRQYEGPLDQTSVYLTLADLQSYIDNDPTSYDGQLVSVAISDTHTDGGLYIVTDDGSNKDLVKLVAGSGAAGQYTQAEIDTALAGKSDTTHTHVEADITDLDKYTQAEVDTALALKSDQTSVDTALALKSDQTAVDTALALKANQSDVDTALTLKSDQTSVDTALNLKANQATTYTKTEVDTMVADVVDTAPEALDTLNELAAALGDDANFATTIATQIGTKADQTAVDTSLALKADQTAVDTALALKSDQTAVTASLALKSDVDHTHVEADITDLDKYTQSEVDTALALKSDQTAVDTALALKADQTAVDTSLALKADQTAVDTALALKSDQTAVDTALALKSDQTAVDTALALKSDIGHTHVEADITNLDKYTQAEVNTALALKADQSSTDTALATKADQATTYTKTEVDTSLTAKADQATTYTKTEADTSLAAKADQATTYTKTEVDVKVAAVVDSAPEALNTLNELASALGDDVNFSTTVATNIGLKADQLTTYTKTEVDTSLTGKADTGHTHVEADITDLDKYTQAEVDTIVAGKLSTGDNLTDSDVVSDIAIGSISIADTVSAGTSIQALTELLLYKTYYPSYTLPSASLTDNISSSVEAGTTGLTLDAGFNAGMITGDVDNGVWDAALKQDDRAGAATQYTFSGATITTTPQAGDVLALPSTVINEGTNTFTVNVDHGAGVQPVDSKGNNYETGLSAGTLSNSLNVTGKRNAFYGVDLASADNAGIRALAGTELGPVNNTTFTINIPAGATDVAFAYPSTLGSVDSVTYTEGLNAEVSGIFTQQTVSVEGKNGYTAVNYILYTYSPASGSFANDATYVVTI